MRCSARSFLSVCVFGLVVVSGVWGLVPAAAWGQVESPQAWQLRGQVEELQRRLEQLRRQEGRDQNVTEIGSSRGRSRPDDEPRLVARIYDLSDLFSIAPSYPAFEPADLQDAARPIFPQVGLSVSGAGSRPSGAAGMGGMGMGGMGGGVFAVPSSISPEAQKSTLHQAAGAAGGTVSDSARTSLDSLIHTISSTISPDEWADVGGRSSIESLGSSLIVSAPVDFHDKVSALLDLFRKRWRSLRTISLEAHWLWLTEAELAAAPLADKNQPAFGALSDGAWSKLRELAAKRAEQHPGYHAMITCYNGQTVHLLAGGQQIVVSGINPVVGGNKEGAGYHPQARIVHEGAALQVTPIATRTAKYVVADVHSRVNLLAGPAEKLVAQAERPLAAGDAAQVVGALDRPVLHSQQLSTTLRIPVGNPALIGGMTLLSGAASEPNLYLFLTAHVQELRDDEPPQREEVEPKQTDESQK